VEDHFRTWRATTLRFIEHENADKCEHAMESRTTR
jgi:hypothetical protein